MLTIHPIFHLCSQIILSAQKVKSPLAKQFIALGGVCLLVFLAQAIPVIFDRQESLSENYHTSVQPLYIPPSIRQPPDLAQRQLVQQQNASSYTVFHNFTFTNHIDSSGITFQHRSLKDSGKDHRANHYDHGSSLASADVNHDGYPDLYFVNQAGPNQLWLNTGKGHFTNSTTPQLAIADRVCVAASFADIDNDGDADLYVTAVRDGNVLLLNDGTGHFTNHTTTAGLDYYGHSVGALFFDYNRDGYLDLFLSNVGRFTFDQAVRLDSQLTYYPGFKDAFGGHLKPERHEPNLLFHNLGNGRFKEMSSTLGLVDSTWSGAASTVDFNKDDWPDLYVLNMQGHDVYYQNMAGKGFVNHSLEYFPNTPWGSMGVKSFDYDNDGLFDLFVTDMHSDMSEDIPSQDEQKKSLMTYPEDFLKSNGRALFGNALFHNRNNGIFEEISQTLGLETYWPWGICTADFNADGWEDIFISAGMNYPFRYGINSLLLNARGKQFVASEFLLNIEPRQHRRTTTPWFQLDCSGADYDHQQCHNQSGQLQVYGALGSRAGIVLDLDLDGDLDIVTNDFNSAPMLLLSNLTEQQPDLGYLKINLVGSASNRSGLGALIRVYADEHIYSKRHDGLSGYLAQSLLPLYFGLDHATSIDSIQVRWPSGQQQTLSGPLPINQLLTVEEPL